ncbi:hypothetical protein JAAARDRAFT_29858 [Jaapia argillacea MUCL 33604]|uniref:Defect at low temperature protein 1 n=1 Tax=Jaapia argillacea MUCL 33604 TaxID=933084 RepID=A0A067QME9_9AGAM|nr:hypothetical protein JAAARDRAFT_29858 [Jaapia argillacea MUCL 33604]
MPWNRRRRETTISEACYLLVVLITACVLAVSCIAILSQAVRNAPNRSWVENANAVVVGGSYVVVLVVSLAYCVKRRVAVRRRMQRIGRVYRIIGKSDTRQPIHEHILQEHARSCLVAYDSQPKEGYQDGWGGPKSKYPGVQYRSALLSTILTIDTLAHSLIPRHPPLRPHDRMLHHFRYIIPLLPKDEDGLTALHYYDSAIQLARHSSREPTEKEYEAGKEAADAIARMLEECRLEGDEASVSELNGSLPN